MRNALKNADSKQLQQRLQLHVERLAGMIGPRHLGLPSTMEAAAEYVRRELAGAGKVETQPYDIDGRQVVNIVLERLGERRPGEIVILGAHYDTVPETPGADDNASAVAVMIEAARLLKDAPLGRTVRFVGFPCEEPPHFRMGTMGSQVYAARCRKNSERVVGMLCLEMVGYFTSQAGSQQAPGGLPKYLRWLLPTRGDFLAAVGNIRSWRLCWQFWRGFRLASRLRIRAVVLQDKVHAIRLSDNSSFWDQGYPALMITDTSFLRNPNYHTPGDTPDSLDYASMAKVCLGVSGALLRIAR